MPCLLLNRPVTHPLIIADLTLNDSANAPKPVTRPSKKKPTAHGDNQDVDDVGEPEDTGIPATDEPAPQTPQKDPEPTYRFILPEIWILISKQIRPEDVSTFAAICRTTYDITRRAQFWFQLYRRYGPHKDRYGGISNDLPMRLRPESMVRLGGLRGCVIRTLYYTYRPFVLRLESLNRNLDLTSFTHRLKILQMWSVQVKAKLWSYHFRLQAPITKYEITGDPLRNIHDNPDEGCRILTIETPKYMPLPQNFDQPQQTYLKSVTYNMSHGLRSYKVNLELVTYNGAPFAKIVLDPAQNIKVWDWWHPAYHLAKNCAQVYVPEEDEDSYFNL